jgi:hypothetical protein
MHSICAGGDDGDDDAFKNKNKTTRRQDDKTRQIGMEERYVAGVIRVAPGVVGG